MVRSAWLSSLSQVWEDIKPMLWFLIGIPCSGPALRALARCGARSHTFGDGVSDMPCIAEGALTSTGLFISVSSTLTGVHEISSLMDRTNSRVHEAPRLSSREVPLLWIVLLRLPYDQCQRKAGYNTDSCFANPSLQQIGITALLGKECCKSHGQTEKLIVSCFIYRIGHFVV